jgi:hypothetical protein
MAIMPIAASALRRLFGGSSRMINASVPSKILDNTHEPPQRLAGLNEGVSSW